jgi:hypothetical protein
MEIELDGFDEFLHSMDIAPEILADEIEKSMRVSLDTFEQAVAVETPVGVSGGLRASITTDISGTKLRLDGRVTTPLIYGAPVEFGRRPGKIPPPGPIALWLYRKGIVTDREQIRAAAWLVARAIGRRGTKGAHMFQKGFDNASPRVLEYWEGLPGRVLEKL